MFSFLNSKEKGEKEVQVNSCLVATPVDSAGRRLVFGITVGSVSDFSHRVLGLPRHSVRPLGPGGHRFTALHPTTASWVVFLPHLMVATHMWCYVPDVCIQEEPVSRWRGVEIRTWVGRAKGYLHSHFNRLTMDLKRVPGDVHRPLKVLSSSLGPWDQRYSHNTTKTVIAFSSRSWHVHRCWHCTDGPEAMVGEPSTL